MAATQTVAQQSALRKQALDSVPEQIPSAPHITDIQPRHGVVTLRGYGIAVRVDRGHLTLEDGVGADRRRCRLPRVDHGLKRLVIIGSDGHVSLSALRWLADQDAAFTMLDRDGTPLVTAGPVRSHDARLHRAQAMALHNGAAFRLSREIIDRKLAGQERVALEKLSDEAAAKAIRQERSKLAEVESIDSIRLVESHAASRYWASWRNLEIMFPRKDLLRVPDHWRSFGSRVSPLTGSPRLASNPVNAILNYLYAILESETRLAAATLGLDPGLGVLHLDTIRRDSLACDLMEPIRPDVDAFVLDWLTREPLSRIAFFEQRDGNCRLTNSLASKLAQTAPTWARLVAPIAEWFADAIYETPRGARSSVPTRLTQRNRREVKGSAPISKVKSAPRPNRICRNCGENLKKGRFYCKPCSEQLTKTRMPEVARLGRVAAQQPIAQTKRSATQRINNLARHAWKASDQAGGLTEVFFVKEIQPRLAAFSGTAIMNALNVCRAYANQIKKGRVPHPRHWRALAELAGVSG